MKKVILLILVGFISSCALTLRKGEYCHEILGGEGGACVKFEEKNKFKWQTNGDLGTISVGSGTYEVKNNKLYLNFKKDSMDYESTVEVLNTKEAEKDSITLAIKVVDKQNLPMPRIKISIAKNPEKNYYTDMEGNVTIQNISKSEKAISIQASAMLGYENYDFTPSSQTKMQSSWLHYIEQSQS